MCGSADLQVGMVINVTTTFITHILPLPAGKPVSPEGMCLFEEMLCEHLLPAGKSARLFQAGYKLVRPMCGSADLQVGMVINVTTTFITHILPLPAGKPVSPEGMCLFGEMLCEHLQCRLESRRAHSRPATSRCARCAGAPTSRSAW